MRQGDIAAEMERARVDFHHLLDNATSAELRAGTDGTKWTNEQLLFHMLFGYLLGPQLADLGQSLHPITSTRLKPSRPLLMPPPDLSTSSSTSAPLGGARVLGDHARMERLLIRDRPAAAVRDSRQRGSLNRGLLPGRLGPRTLTTT